MANDLFDIPDWRLLRYFSIIAEEGSMRRAAERLFMTQPPLSRHIKRLEEMLGVALFVRHSKGLTLTREGMTVLRIARPVLEAQEAAAHRLRSLARNRAGTGAPLRIGLTTAFEQGIFARFMQRIGELNGAPARYMRQPSPQLGRRVRQGRLNAALVALPLEAPGLRTVPLNYAEPLLAALPASWLAALPHRDENQVRLQDLNGKPLFWFRRESNPAYFDYMRGVFSHVGFTPVYLEEPEEHDVLLARIAQGEGMGMLPRSFSAIGRRGVVFCPLAEEALLEIQLGLAMQTDDGDADVEANVGDNPQGATRLRRLIAAAAPCLGVE